MSEGNQQNWGKKGACISQFVIALLLFFGLLIWVYKKNQHGLN